MKIISAAILLSASTATAFQAGPIFPKSASTSVLGMGFLDGKGTKITVREDEDAAMWIDDGSGGRASADKPKKPDPKKPVKKDEPKKGGFKFPWDK